MSQAGDKPLLLRAEEEFSLDLLSQVGGLPSIIASLSSLLLRTTQTAAGALCFLTSKGCSYIKVQPEELQPALEPLMACVLSDDKALQEHATGALANAARHASLQPYFTESNCHVTLLQLVASGSEIACANCGRALELLAESSAASHHFSQLPVLQQLVALLSHANISSQQIGLSICCNLFASWPASQHLTAAALHQAVEHFIELRGMTALRCVFQRSHMQESAASCLSMLAHLEPSPSAFALSGTLQLLLRILKSHERPFETQAAATSVNIRQHAAKAVAALMQNSDCASVAIQPANLKLILQLFHDPSLVIWESALTAMAALTTINDNAQHLGASEALDASTLKEMLCEAAGCHSQDTESKQSQLLLNLCRSQSCQKLVVDCGGLTFLSRRMKSSDTTTQSRAAGAVRQLAMHEDSIRDKCLETTIPIQVVQLLRSIDDNVQSNAAAALQALACGDATHELQLLSIGSLQPLIEHLTSASTDLKCQAARVIRNICWSHDVSRQRAAELGALPPLIAMSNSNNAEVKQAAQSCLTKLALLPAVKESIRDLQL